MTKGKKWLISVGWIAYSVTWLALLANIVNDWLTRQWISPLSIIIFGLLGGGTTLQLLRGEPIIDTDGAASRLLITVALILFVCLITLGGIALSSLG